MCTEYNVNGTFILFILISPISKAFKRGYVCQIAQGQISREICVGLRCLNIF